MTVTDTEGLKPIEVSFELPMGVVLQGRVVDKTTGRVAHHRSGAVLRDAGDPAGKAAGHAYAEVAEGDAFRLTVPPGGPGMVVAKIWASRVWTGAP